MKRLSKTAIDWAEFSRRIEDNNIIWNISVDRGAKLVHRPVNGIMSDRHREVSKALSRSSVGQGRAGNRHVRDWWRQQLLKAIRPKFERILRAGWADSFPRFVTIIPAGFDISETDRWIKLKSFKAMLSELLADLSWVGLIELVRINNVTPPMSKGRLVSVHCHLLIWGWPEHTRFSTRVLRRPLPKRAMLGAKPFHHQAVESLAELDFRVRYLFKMPLMGKVATKHRVVTKSGDTTIKFKLKGARKPVHRGGLNLFLTLSQYELADLVISGGEGTDLVEAIQELAAA